MVYTFDNETKIFRMKEEGFDLYQKKNPTTGKPFKDAEEAEEWFVGHYKIVGDRYLTELDMEKARFFVTYEEVDNEKECTIEVRRLATDEFVEVLNKPLDEVKDTPITEMDLDDGEYYIDVKFEPRKGYTLNRKENVSFKLTTNSEGIKVLEPLQK